MCDRYYGDTNYNKGSFPGCPIYLFRPASSTDGRLIPAPSPPTKRNKNKQEDGDYITATCFASGAVMIAGCKNIQDGVFTFEHVIPLIQPFVGGPAAGAEEQSESPVPARVSQQDRRRLGNQTHRSLSPNDKEWYLSKRYTAKALAAFPLSVKHLSTTEWDAFLSETFGNR